ncbi:MAG: peroxide stress protein YaaA [Treponema sp.]|nr:peroxide stress protein YaaA [Treponema sp.]
MKVIISPAKNMTTKADALEPTAEPVFIQQAQKLVDYLKSLPFEQLKTLLACNENLAQLNYQRYQTMDLHAGTNPALVSYEGIQYQYMAPRVFTYEYFDYAQEHVRILSGLYGILRPFDAIVPYRLEMQAKLKTDFCKNLYDFWGESLYQELTKDSNIIINLASDEYSKAIKKYVQPTDRFITCRFCEQGDGKLVEKGVYVKMARGEMVRYMAEQDLQVPEDMKSFTGLGYGFSQEHSTENLYTFIR